jgi:hypothetical protein
MGVVFHSAEQLLTTPVPDVSFYWGDILRTNGMLTIVAKPKMFKSFLAIQGGLNIATGTEFLGMPTKKGNVLYFNFEIAAPMFQQRLQDVFRAMDIPPPGGFEVIHADASYGLDTPKGKSQFDKAITEFIKNHGSLDVIIIDPRRNAMAGDENQSEIMTTWCQNLKSLMTKYSFASIVVHHEGKNTTGSGRGSSVFDAFVDTTVKLWSKNNFYGADLTARDSALDELRIERQHPLWQISEAQQMENASQVEKAIRAIRDLMVDISDWSRDELRTAVMAKEHSDYSFREAIARLKSKNEITEFRDPNKQGNWKRFRKESHT